MLEDLRSSHTNSLPYPSTSHLVGISHLFTVLVSGASLVCKRLAQRSAATGSIWPYPPLSAFFCASDFQSSKLNIQRPSCQIAFVHGESDDFKQKAEGRQRNNQRRTPQSQPPKTSTPPNRKPRLVRPANFSPLRQKHAIGEHGERVCKAQSYCTDKQFFFSTRSAGQAWS